MAPESNPAGFDASNPIGKFMQAFMHSWNSGTGLAEVDFYADRARYDGQEVRRSVIAKKAATYNARWPKRSFWLIGAPTVETVDDSVRRVHLKAGFSVENTRRRVTGEAIYTVDVAPAGDTYQVTALDEQITKRDSYPVAGR